MSNNLQAQLHHAFEAHQQGKFADAEAAYRNIIACCESQAAPPSVIVDAHQLLGTLLIQAKRPQEAIGFIERAIQLNPNTASYYLNLGTAYSRLGQLESAVAAYQQALSIDPIYAEAHRNCGTSLRKLKRFSDAIPHLSQALLSNPNSRDVRSSLAICLLRSGKELDSVAHFEWLVERFPDDLQALLGLAQALLKDKGNKERCANCWQTLTTRCPERIEYWNNYASSLKSLERHSEAIAACERALSLDPAYFPALCNLGLTQAALGDFDIAAKTLETAVENFETRFQAPQPSHQDPSTSSAVADQQELLPQAWLEQYGCLAYSQLATVSNLLGDTARARHMLSKALNINPDHNESQLLRGFLNLQEGNYEAGWPDYEARKNGDYAPRVFKKGQLWCGQPLQGARLLIHAEQGMGDAIQFIRYAKLIRERGGKVYFLCHRPLVKLLHSCGDVEHIIPDGDPLPEYDFHIPLMSLPHALGTTLATVPAQIPYLTADPQLVSKWNATLRRNANFKVAIAWQGNPEFAYDKYRSVPLRFFEELAAVPGVELVSVQAGFGLEQLQGLEFHVTHYPELDAQAGPFMDTAAIMQAADLVISSDTATIHLAGALGRPVWLAKSFTAEWRWFSDDRESNPWYPTMRMFKQATHGDWKSVFKRMREALEPLAAAQHSRT